MNRPPKKPWSEMTLEEKETRAMGCALAGVALARLNSIVLSDIVDHCEDWCMVPNSCPPSCPLYKYIKAFEENDIQDVADRRKQRREEQRIAREYFETNHLRKKK